MLCTAAINASNTIRTVRTQTDAAERKSSGLDSNSSQSQNQTSPPVRYCPLVSQRVKG